MVYFTFVKALQSMKNEECHKKLIPVNTTDLQINRALLLIEFRSLIPTCSHEHPKSRIELELRSHEKMTYSKC